MLRRTHVYFADQRLFFGSYSRAFWSARASPQNTSTVNLDYDMRSPVCTASGKWLSYCTKQWPLTDKNLFLGRFEQAGDGDSGQGGGQRAGS